MSRIGLISYLDILFTQADLFKKIKNLFRACLNFPIKKYYQVIFAFSFGLSSRFHLSDGPLSSS